MKITKIEVIPVDVPYLGRVREYLRLGWRMEQMPSVKTCVYKVHTDEGIVGIGEGTANLKDRTSAYIGRSPFEFALDDSAGPLQIAFYDIMGKTVGLPVHHFFGPKKREKILTAYWSHCFPPEVLAQEAKIAIESGFTVHKIKARPFRDPVQQVEHMVEVVPSDYRIAVDANGTFDTPINALRIARAFERYSNVWALETPIDQQNIDGYRFLKSKLDYPIAIHSDQPPQITAIKMGMCDAFVLEFEWSHNVVRQAAVAEAAGGMPLWIENGLYSGISAMFQTHQAAAIQNAELCISLCFLMENDLIVEPLLLKDGYMDVPTKPGLGIELDDTAIDRYRVG